MIASKALLSPRQIDRGDRMIHNSALIALFISLFLTACGKPELSRPEAAKQIQTSQELLRMKRTVWLQPDAQKMGTDQGLWQVSTNQFGYPLTSPVLGEKAKKFIDSISLANFALILKEPVDVRIEITGVAPVPMAESVREAQFTWSYEGLPSLVKRFALKGGSGSAHFRLYDDGWRLEDVELKRTNVAATMTAQEQQEELADQSAEMERRRQEQETRRAAADKLAKRLQESKTPTKVILALNFPDHCRDQRPREIKVTDVGLVFCDMFGNRREVWFGHILGFSPNEGTPSKTEMDIFLREMQTGASSSSDYMFRILRVQEGQFLNALTQAVQSWKSRFPDMAPRT